MKKIRTEILLSIVITIIVGFMSGILGYIVIGSGGNLPFLGQVDFGGTNWDRQIVIEQPRSVVVEQDLQLKQVENDVLPTLTSVYFWKQSANNVSQTYLLSEIVSGGIMLTADGWMISTDKSLSLDVSKYRVFDYSSKELEIEKIIEDKETGIVFSKLKIDNSPVVRMGDVSDIHVGQTLVIMSRKSGVTLTNVAKYGYEFQTIDDVILSSDTSERELILDTDLQHELDGTVLANLKGEILGIVRNGEVVLVDQFKNVINQVLGGQEIARPVLAIKYLDLSRVDGLSDLGDKGALVIGAPLKSSPAYGKLLDGDILLSIDDIGIDSQNSLHDLVGGYDSGDELEFLVLRNNSELTVDVVLK
jgi:S1-C subfamily serine protease